MAQKSDMEGSNIIRLILEKKYGIGMSPKHIAVSDRLPYGAKINLLMTIHVLLATQSILLYAHLEKNIKWINLRYNNH